MEKNDILYEDNEIIVCRKPAGVPVQSARIGQKDMVSILNNYLAEKSPDAAGDAEAERPVKGSRRRDAGYGAVSEKGKGSRIPELYVVHRLDQPVEGVLVFAKTKKAAAELGRQVTDGRMKKTYHAVCCCLCGTDDRELSAFCGLRGTDDRELSAFCGLHGTDDRKFPAGSRKNERITLIDYLVKDGRTNVSFIADKNKKDAKRAELSYRILEQKCISHKTDKMYILAEIDLKTGRHHQIRVQMANAGLPLFGDRKYHPQWEAFIPEKDSCQISDRLNGSLALCAVSLSLLHPVSGRRMTFQVKPEGEIFRMFDHLFRGDLRGIFYQNRNTPK